MRDFSCEANKHKNGKCLGITFLCFYGFPRKRSKRPIFLVLQLPLYEAKTHFSKLVNSVIHGDEIIIAMAGKPVAKLGLINKKPERTFGVLKGKIKIAKDFVEVLPDEFLNDFEA